MTISFAVITLSNVPLSADGAIRRRIAKRLRLVPFHESTLLDQKVFVLNYDMGSLIQIELSAILSPDIFTIAQPPPPPPLGPR